MKVKKENVKVLICCVDGSEIKGIVHINPGERLSDFIEDNDNIFIIVSGAELLKAPEPESFKMALKVLTKKNVIMLNRSCIKYICEI